MEIVLHIGPHKTGTTSIQKFLRKRGQKAKKGIFYPPAPDENGPGHALLAWKTLGIKEDMPPIASLDEVVSQAAIKGIQKLIFSAEDFSIAFFVGMDRLVESLGKHKIHLVCTYTPVVRRVLSIWQEEVKHGACYPLNDIPNFTSNSPTLQPTLARKFMEALKPHKVSLILAYSRDPLALLTVFSEVIGLNAAPNPAIAPSNVSLGTVEAETLRALNVLSHRHGVDPESAKELRLQLLRLFLSDAWKQHSQKIPLGVPDAAVASFVERLTGEFDREFDRLRQDPRVSIYDTRLAQPSLKVQEPASRKRRMTGSLRRLVQMPQWSSR